MFRAYIFVICNMRVGAQVRARVPPIKKKKIESENYWLCFFITWLLINDYSDCRTVAVWRNWLWSVPCFLFSLLVFTVIRKRSDDGAQSRINYFEILCVFCFVIRVLQHVANNIWILTSVFYSLMNEEPYPINVIELNIGDTSLDVFPTCHQ